MSEEMYPIAITALMPLTAGLLVVQKDPYQALIIRGILGAIAALIYCLFGAADIALTEALVGTMLSITLYAIAVRSSMKIRFGVLESLATETVESAHQPTPTADPAVSTHTADSTLSAQFILSQLKEIFIKHHVRVELVKYSTSAELSTALKEKEIHIAYLGSGPLQTRLQQLHTLIQGKLPSTLTVTPVSQPVTATPAANV